MNFLYEPGITTISFFDGADHSTSLQWLKTRLGEIARVNPWLTGRLVRDKKKTLCLSFPQQVTEADVEAIVCSESKVLQTISTDTSYRDLSKAIVKAGAMVKTGYKLIGKDARVSKFTLVQVDKGLVALIVSMTHTIADGFTYYRILSMLNGPVEELSAKRKAEFITKSVAALGEEEHRFLSSPTLTCNVISTKLFGSKFQMVARLVDDEKVAKAKVEAAKRMKVSETDFVCSTNDILTSSFGKAADARFLMMAMNFRDRLDGSGVTKTDAGNYMSLIGYDPLSYASPELIRQSFQDGPPFKRIGGGPLPSIWESLRLPFALITTWAFPGFKADLTLLDASKNPTAPITLHLPVEDLSSMPFPYAIVFRPCVGKLAVAYFGDSSMLSYDRLCKSGAPLGERVFQ